MASQAASSNRSTDIPSINTGSTTSTRAKIEERLQRAINAAPPTKNRSPELVPLAAEYEKMKRNGTYGRNGEMLLAIKCVLHHPDLFFSVRNLVSLVKKYGETTKAMNVSRDDVSHCKRWVELCNCLFEGLATCSLLHLLFSLLSWCNTCQ